MKEYYVYILKSLKDGRYYIGSSGNIEGRLKFHNAGLQRSTRHRVPFSIAYVEAKASKAEALQREKLIKSYKGGLFFITKMHGIISITTVRKL